MKERNAFFSNVGLCMKLALVTLLMIGGGNFAWGDEVTVYGDQSYGNNAYIPINGQNVGSTYVQSEFIIPSSDISSVANKNITKLTFYLKTKANNEWGSAVFRVFLKEVDASIQSNFTGSASSSIVYEGGLCGTGDEMEVTFSSPFYYGGTKNLLIGIYCITLGTGSGNTSTFCGKTNYSDTDGVSVYGTSGSVNLSKFRPKTTITYETPALKTLSISPDEDANFGTVWENDTKEYVITNNSGSTVNVVPTITGTDASSFSVSPENANIESGDTRTFTLTFNYNSNLGSKTASITFTPGEDSGNAITKNITANAVPDLMVSPDEAAAFGNVTGDANKVYTITNHTGSAVNITPSITGTNADMFTVSPSVETPIDDGDSQTFTLTFDWQADISKLGEKTATLKLTPDNGYSAFSFSASATAGYALTLDEDNATTIIGGTKSILIKFTPSNGWNTICMPIPMYNSYSGIDNMGTIFGTGWKAYTLQSYAEGVLTFQKATYLGAGSAYLVYSNNVPAVHQDLLVVANPTYTSPETAAPINGATFQGTYVTKTYNALTDEASPWYGVTPAGKVMKAGTGAAIKGYRAYFTGVSAPAGARISIVIEGDDETTDLSFVKMVDENATDVYTLSGQKVKKGNKGIYIVNGRKVVIK